MRPLLSHLTAIVCLVALLAAPRAARSADWQENKAAGAPEAERLRLVSQDEIEAETWRQKAEELSRQGDVNGAHKAFGEAIRRYVKLYLWETSGMRTPKPEATVDERKRYRERVAKRLKVAAENIEKYFASGEAEAGLGRDQLKTIQIYARLLDASAGSDEAAFFAGEVDRKAVIISRPEPVYTEEARGNRVGGAVALRMVLAADGKVRHILVVRGLPDGLTESAIEAARQMRFEPAVKDGRPVALFVTVEYNFNTY